MDEECEAMFDEDDRPAQPHETSLEQVRGSGTAAPTTMAVAG